MEKSFNVIERLQMLDCLMKEGKTGKPSQLAKNLGISQNHLCDHIAKLNE